MSEISKIIEKNKIVIFYEDTLLEDRRLILESHTNLRRILKCLHDFTNEIIVISNKNRRKEVYSQAIEEHILIDFESTSKLKKPDYDFSKFKGKVVIFDKCFDGMTSEENNTYKNIIKIRDVSKKFIGVDTIGFNYLSRYYFSSSLLLTGCKEELDYGRVQDTDYMNMMLIDNFYIINQGEVLTRITNNYWYDTYTNKFYSESKLNHDDLLDYETAEKLMSNFSVKVNLKKQNKRATNDVNLYLKKKINIRYIITLVLAIYLGLFGAHRFYNRQKSAKMMLFTLGGLGIWWITDIILIITGNYKVNEQGKLKLFKYKMCRE